MTQWSAEGLASRLGGFELGPVDLDLGEGHAVAVLGSSGAGKTTLLRTLAGFLPARAGRLLRDGRDVTDHAPERRGLGYVPQGLGLLPHRTVERNVSYPLEVRGRTDARSRARSLLDRFGLRALAGRRPAQLSGGELERVALARALAAEPELVLWDEPWQALDVEARHELALVFDELREADRVPVVVVTHDPALAFSVAGSFLVLRRGRVAFLGAPMALLERPVDRFTARFVGFENVYDRSSLCTASPDGLAAWLRARAGAEGVAFPRPRLPPEGGGGGRWEGIVHSARPTPDGVALAVATGGLSVAVLLPAPTPRSLPRPGDRLRFDIDEGRVRALGPDGSGPG